MTFNSPFSFGATNLTVVIQNVDNKFLRVSPNNLDLVDGNGGKGGFAQWTIEGNGDIRKFKNNKSGKYLRIIQNDVIDCLGSGGPWTQFKVHGTGNDRKLESVKINKKYIAYRNGKVVTGAGGKFCSLKFFRNVPFSTPYHFVKQNETVVIKNVENKHLRVSPNNLTEIDGNGGKGQFAQWIIEGTGDVRKFKNVKSGKYLRLFNNNKIDVNGSGGPWTTFKLHGQGYSRKLESTKIPGKYIAFRNGKVVDGAGGKFCIFEFYKR